MQEAYNYYVQSLNLYCGLDDRPNIVRSLIRLSHLSGWADFGDGLDMFARRKKLGSEALPLAREIGDPALLSEALCAFSAGLPRAQAKAMLEESVALAESCNDKAALARALSWLGKLTKFQDRERARGLEERALHLYQETGDKAGTAGVLFSLSICADKPQKRAHLEQALELQRALGAKRRIYETLMMLSRICEPQELDLREAYSQEALELCRQLGTPSGTARCLDRLAAIARERGDIARAETLEAERRQIPPEPEMDPASRKAFDKALRSGVYDKAIAAVKKFLKP